MASESSLNSSRSVIRNLLETSVPRRFLRSHVAREQLVVDLLALSSGLRACAMLDYAAGVIADPYPLLLLLKKLQQEIPNAAPIRMFLMAGCAYLVNTAALHRASMGIPKGEAQDGRHSEHMRALHVASGHVETTQLLRDLSVSDDTQDLKEATPSKESTRRETDNSFAGVVPLPPAQSLQFVRILPGQVAELAHESEKSEAAVGLSQFLREALMRVNSPVLGRVPPSPSLGHVAAAAGEVPKDQNFRQEVNSWGSVGGEGRGPPFSRSRPRGMSKSSRALVSGDEGAGEIPCLDASLDGCPVLLPTINGWLLGYPVVYLFLRRDLVHPPPSLSSVVRPALPLSSVRISASALHVFRLSVSWPNEGGGCPEGSRQSADRGGHQTVLSFSVPVSLFPAQEFTWTEALFRTAQRVAREHPSCFGGAQFSLDDKLGADSGVVAF